MGGLCTGRPVQWRQGGLLFFHGLIVLASVISWYLVRNPLPEPLAKHTWSLLVQVEEATLPTCPAVRAAVRQWKREFYDGQTLMYLHDPSFDWWLYWHGASIRRTELLPPAWSSPCPRAVAGDGSPKLFDSGYLPKGSGASPSQACVVYSVRSDGHTTASAAYSLSFEHAMLSNTACDVWLFDCTADESMIDRTIDGWGGDRKEAEGAGKGMRSRMHIRKECVGEDGQRANGHDTGSRQPHAFPLRSLLAIQRELGHEHVDIMRLRAMGWSRELTEQAALRAYVRAAGAEGFELPSQLILEARFGGSAVADTKATLGTFHSLYSAGYLEVYRQPPVGSYMDMTFIMGCEGWQARCMIHNLPPKALSACGGGPFDCR